MPIRRLVFHEQLDETPPEVLGRLREIDSTVELVKAAEPGMWWLGSVEPSGDGFRVRKLAGERILQNEAHRPRPNPSNVLLGKLMMQGFSLIAAYTGDPSGIVKDGEGFDVNIVEDFAERDFNYRNRAEETFQRRYAEGTGQYREAEANRILLDKLHTDGRDAFVRSQRQRVTVGYSRG